jgi:hypothetical protein
VVSATTVSLARHTTRRETWLLPLALRERIERVARESTVSPERILAAGGRDGPAAPAVRSRAVAARAMVPAQQRGEAARAAPVREPANETIPREGDSVIAHATPDAPAPPLDELVDQVLRRIERRAVAQRERLGRA